MENVARKQFFFEEKPKNFYHLPRISGGSHAKRNKSFLVLFFKKELLLFVPAGANLKRKH